MFEFGSGTVTGKTKVSSRTSELARMELARTWVYRSSLTLFPIAFIFIYYTWQHSGYISIFCISGCVIGVCSDFLSSYHSSTNTKLKKDREFLSQTCWKKIL
jgi:hypothetical protein